MNSIEILSPAGSVESIYPAVRMGADAVYLGLKSFSARNKAANFDKDELIKTVEYCHAADVKVYVALNTLIKDDEIKEAAALAEFASSLPVDAFIIQDMGLFSVLHELYPDMNMHASTQTSVHTKYGVKFLYDRGFKRIVLPRELSKSEIEKIVSSCPIETEVFVHGALCMSFSGQCYMSAMIGTRSANRGICAGSCRLPFMIEGAHNDYALSLKDNSIISKLKELEKIGVTSAKIEGRMKRPEYTAITAKACKNELSGTFNKETEDCLKAVFSRDGFTSGYYDGKINGSMFGKREKENVLSANKKVLSEIRQLYKDEVKKVAVSFKLTLKKDKITLTVSDKNKNEVRVSDVSDVSGGFAAEKEQIISQLSKTGSTIFYVEEADVKIEDGMSVKLSVINKLRRECLKKLFEKRSKRPDIRKNNDFYLKEYGLKNDRQGKIKIRAWFENSAVPFCCKRCEFVYIPLSTDLKELDRLLKSGFNIAVHIPRFIESTEKILEKLEQCKKIGINDAWCGTIDALEIIRKCKMQVHAGFSMNVFNKYSLDFLHENGAGSAELSPELTFSEIEKLASADIKIKTGIIAYGYMPMMLLRNCPAKYTENGCHGIKGKKCCGIYLKDRLGKKFRVLCKENSVEILNSLPLNIIKEAGYVKFVDFMVFRFTVENSVEKFENYDLFNTVQAPKTPKTRGLYLRGVE